ncbi:MAG: hypothetical protein J6Y86_10795 [Pseudobutyrivibrio sp.]|nr:hypothetical protein [Pseudobutyrivibrio sp.]
MGILALGVLGALGGYSTYKSYRSKNGGKFYSAPETKKHYDNISTEFESYSKLAEALKGEMDAIATTDSYEGEDADGVKQLMNTTEPETLGMILDLHKKLEQYYADVIDTFASKVDSSPEAFLSFDMLDLIKQDFWDMLDAYNTEAKIAKEKIEEYSNKYSAKYNHTITIPDFTPGENAFLTLCGEEDGDSGFLYDCQKKLVDFDEEMSTSLANLNLMDLVDSINQKIITIVTDRYPDSGLEQYVDDIDKFEKEYNYAKQFFTGDDEVDCQIINILLTYGHDLSSFDDVGWEDMSTDRRKAYTRITEVDIEYMDGHYSNEECIDQEARVKTVLWLVMNDGESEEDLIFNSERTSFMKDNMTSEVSKRYITTLGAAKLSEHPEFMIEFSGSYALNITVEQAGVHFTFTSDENNNYEEITVSPSYNRAKNYISYCEDKNPGCFDHQIEVLEAAGWEEDRARANLASIYTKAENSTDDKFLTNLFTSDSNYENVFNVDPEKLSENVQLVVGNQMIMLASDDYANGRYKELTNFINAAIGAEVEIDGHYYPATDYYLDFLAVSSSVAADSLKTTAWYVDLNDKNVGKFGRKVEIAEHLELLMYSCAGYLNGDSEYESISLAECQFAEGDVITFVYSKDSGKAPTTITINEAFGSSATNANVTNKISELREKTKQSEIKLCVSTAYDVITLFLPDLPEKYEKAKKIYDGAASIASLIIGIQKINDEYNEEYKKLLEEYVTFYSYMYYVDDENADGTSSGYYTLSFDAIKLIRTWDEKGIGALYTNAKDAGLIVEKYDSLCGISVDGYSSEDITKAVNTIIYGANNSKYDTYSSVSDIPLVLLVRCFQAIDMKVDGIADVETELTNTLDPGN